VKPPESGTSKNLEIGVGIIYSPADDAIDSEYKVWNKKDAIGYAITTVMKEMENRIPEGSLCTVIFGINENI